MVLLLLIRAVTVNDARSGGALSLNSYKGADIFRLRGSFGVGFGKTVKELVLEQCTK